MACAMIKEINVQISLSNLDMLSRRRNFSSKSLIEESRALPSMTEVAVNLILAVNHEV